MVERANRTVMEMACSMLQDAGLPNMYWGEACLYTIHILNRTPLHLLDGDTTPHEVFTGNKPWVQGFRPYPGREAQKARSQVARVCAHWLVPNKCTYRLLHCPTGRVYESRDVVFVEGDTSSQPHQVTISVDPIPAFPNTPAPAPAPENSVPTPKFKVMVEDVPDEGEVAPPPPSSSDALEGPPEHDIKLQPLPAEPIHRSTHVRNPPIRDDNPSYKVSS